MFKRKQLPSISSMYRERREALRNVEEQLAHARRAGQETWKLEEQRAVIISDLEVYAVLFKYEQV